MANQKRIDNFLEEIRTAFIKTIELLGNVKDDSFHSVIKASHDKIADKYRDIVYRSRVVWEDYDGLVYIHYETGGWQIIYANINLPIWIKLKIFNQDFMKMMR